MSSFSLKLLEISQLITQVYSTLEERKQYIQLDIIPSVNDNNELHLSINKILKKLNYFQDDLIELIKTNGSSVDLNVSNKEFVKLVKELTGKFEEKVVEYVKLLDNMELILEKEISNQDQFNLSNYKFVKKELPSIPPLLKTVRFKENLEEFDNVKPFKDEPVEDITENIGEIHVSTNNNQFKPYSDDPIEQTTPALELQKQQEIIQFQDDNLNQLTTSIKRQKQMGLTINEELDDQLIILDDLENQISSSQNNLSKARRRLQKVNENMKKHGNCLVITVLSFILFILVTVF